jgi:TRAP-type C4-dicarboxylate transport system permease small subunit
VALLIRRLERWAMWLAAGCVVLIMLVVCVDAGGRYLFRKPLPWSFDLVSNYLMVGAAWLALSSTYRHGDHISIDLLRVRLSPRVRAGVDVVTGLLALILFAAIATTNFERTYDSLVGHEYNPGYILWPVWLSFAPIPIGAALLVLRLLHHVVAMATRGEDPEVLTEAGVEGAE